MEPPIVRDAGPTPRLVLGLLTGAVAAAGLAALLVLEGMRVPAGLAVLAAGGLLVAGEYLAGEGGTRLALASTTADRLVDALVLGSLAWELLGPDPGAGVAALMAFSVSFVAAYVRARARSLGYVILESGLARPARMVAVAVGLLAANVEAGLWTATGVGVLSLVARARELRVQVKTP